MTAVDVSPDGTQVVYSTCAYPTDPEFTYTPSTRHGTDADGNPIIVITSVDPDPELLNYDHELVRVNIDDSEPQRLTSNAHFDNYPAWSPDGTRIAYLSNDNRYASASNPHSTSFLRLYTMAPDGSNVAMVRDGFVNLFQPLQWSPDSKRLAYVRQDAESGVWLYTVTVEWGAPRRLTNTVSYPTWSPDGQRIAFAKPDGNEVALYTIASDGSDAQRVTTIRGWQPRDGETAPTLAGIGTVAWSPDGSKILFSCGGGICVVSLDGTPVSEAPLSGNAAAWSPDGSRIAILNTEYLPLLQTVAPDGSNLRLLVIEHDDGLQAVAPRHVDEPGDIAGCSTGKAVPQPDANPGLVQDCETLLVVQAQLAAVGILGWTTDRPITEWEGVVLGDWPLRVRRLTLARLGLSGGIPPELARLTQLSRLDLRQNSFGGGIPPELGTLAELRVLNLGWNHLTGTIPAELAELTKLQELDLEQNRLTGTVPPEFGSLTRLGLVSLRGNQLTGCIPPAIGRRVVDRRYLGLPYCEAA